MKEIQEFFSNLRSTFPTVSLWDIIDILLVAVLIYYVINLIWNTSARRIAWAIVMLLAATLLTDLLNLHAVNYLLDRVLQLGFVALVIVFQPELRRLLERVGSRGTVKNLIGLTQGPAPTDSVEAIDQIVQACESMSNERVGALIVFERANSLEQIAATGTRVDAAVSQELIRNIFFPKAPLHDGAAIIRNFRVCAAGCILPLTKNNDISSSLGTRHRAAIGMSEQSDALVIVVSEETGAISVAEKGNLRRNISDGDLREILSNSFSYEDTDKGFFKKIRRDK